MLMIRFQNLFLVLMNASKVVGFKHSQLLHTSHTLMLTPLMFWKGSKIHFSPFWICTTLIFVAASIGTFVTYIAHKLQKKEWNYDINLVTWSAGSVLWLCPCCSSCIICNSQVLFSTIRPCSTVLSLWLLLICLYSGTVLLSGALGNLQMGDSRRGRVHVSNLRGPKSPSPYYVGR
ncbi:PROTEIN YIPF [Salix koriyanagi]|uniref:PROTEIN YIPF n=1 Tax=Salix koriyanagi TaxID=2511006 RepID=A0A9Q0P7D0_9ROSI|nr:PROTEIN YIPF [Salix koriyanagi]